MLTTFTAGFALGLGLILAIGAQNAFVLRQGLHRAHVFWICLTCAVSDALLIWLGIAGSGVLAASLPWFEPVARFGGAAFLIVYGALRLREAWRGGAAIDLGDGSGSGLWPALLSVLAFTWLNPHVYLDTVVLIGSVSTHHDNRLAFGLGAVTSSFVFFFALGYGARLLAPLFARPRAWQALDLAIGLLMWAIAVKLLAM